jgi:hypothetical protein
MPCRSDGWDAPYREDLKELEMLRAVVCAFMTAYPDEYSKINWKKAGVRQKELELWWETHQEKDRARREQEEKARREHELKKAALARLTDEELRLLGLKRGK